MALVAAAKRDVLLRVHRHRLRREDLEDAYAQATLELVVLSRRGRAFQSRRHLANALEQRFVARVTDRRRALSGRSPIEAAIEGAVTLAPEAEPLELPDTREEPERLAIAREELAGALRNLPKLTPDHDAAYVRLVESWARRYRGSALVGEPAALQGSTSLAALQARTTTQVRVIPGKHAMLAPGDGHLALVPAGVPLSVAAMIVAGNELQDLPYGPAGHPDPLGAAQEDCSSTVNYVLFRAGSRPLGQILRDNPLAQDYVTWGEPGPGRWVTIYATDAPSPHVFMTIAGLRLDTSHDGTDVGPNRFQDGPRWRVLDRIPAWAHWSVRHPPGL